MKKIPIIFAAFLLLFSFFTPATFAIEPMDFYQVSRDNISPIPCGNSESNSCPKEMKDVYDSLGDECSSSYADFQSSPNTLHYWIEDPAITAQGKSNERARQFIYWAVNNNAVDNHPVIREVWNVTSNVAFFFVIFVAALLGLGFIVSRRTSFTLNLELWPTLIKILLMLLYIALSASVVLLLIQLSEIFMRFFIDNLGGRDLFNIYFSSTGTAGSTELNYTDFVGCRDLNVRTQEAIDTKMFLYKLTNITYYIMGTMIILRKILLWFLLFIAPFLALLMPFTFIRNVGWIWIGVFFQWLMYGPIFALFLGSLSKIWKAGIPFQFDFSRVLNADTAFNGAVADPLVGYTYPTAMNILYGGPAQINGKHLSAINSGNYVDTFAEYVITLIMLWAVTFFPWWLLRIFRDYCCDGIYAMKNVLFAMYDEMRGNKNPKGPTNTPSFDLKTELKVPTDTTNQLKTAVKMSTLASVKQMDTRDISKSLNIKVSNLTDIARLEQNQNVASQVQKNLASLANPAQVSTSTERQQFMNLRTELFNRAIKQDSLARTLLSSTSSSSYERGKVRQELIKSITTNVSKKSAGMVASESMQSVTRDVAATIAGTTAATAQAGAMGAAGSAMGVAGSTSTAGSASAMGAASSSNKQSQTTSASTSNRQLGSYAAGTQVSSQAMRTLAKEMSKSIAAGTTSVSASNPITVALNDASINAISAKTKLNSDKTRTVLERYAKSSASSMNQAVSLLAKELRVDSNVIRETILAATSKQAEKTNKILSTYLRSIDENSKALTRIAKKNGLTADNARMIVRAFASSMDKPANEVIQNITNVTKLSESQVKGTLGSLNNMFTTRSIITDFADEHNMEVSKVMQAVSNTAGITNSGDSPEGGGPTGSTPLNPTSVYADITITGAAKTAEAGATSDSPEIGVGGTPGPKPTSEEKQIAEEIAKRSIAANTTITGTESVPTDTQANKEQTYEVIKLIAEDTSTTDKIIKDVAREENVTESEAAAVVGEQIQISAKPEENIEKIVSVPASITIEEYEDLKDMWENQYEDGEIPLSENIRTREEWVNQDVVTITNVMNKILSSNEELQQQGLDELGFIIPVFMINDLKGDQLVTYLKAKLEAAKLVKKMIERENRLRQKFEIREEEETLLDVKAEKKVAPKELKMDLPEDDSKPKTIEDIGQTDFTQAKPEVNKAYLKSEISNSQSSQDVSEDRESST